MYGLLVLDSLLIPIFAIKTKRKKIIKTIKTKSKDCY